MQAKLWTDLTDSVQWWPNTDKVFTISCLYTKVKPTVDCYVVKLNIYIDLRGLYPVQDWC